MEIYRHHPKSSLGACATLAVFYGFVHYKLPKINAKVHTLVLGGCGLLSAGMVYESSKDKGNLTERTLINWTIGLHVGVGVAAVMAATYSYKAFETSTKASEIFSKIYLTLGSAHIALWSFVHHPLKAITDKRITKLPSLESDGALDQWNTLLQSTAYQSNLARTLISSLDELQPNDKNFDALASIPDNLSPINPINEGFLPIRFALMHKIVQIFKKHGQNQHAEKIKAEHLIPEYIRSICGDGLTAEQIQQTTIPELHRMTPEDLRSIINPEDLNPDEQIKALPSLQDEGALTLWNNLFQSTRTGYQSDLMIKLISSLDDLNLNEINLGILESILDNVNNSMPSKHIRVIHLILLHKIVQIFKSSDQNQRAEKIRTERLIPLYKKHYNDSDLTVEQIQQDKIRSPLGVFVPDLFRFKESISENLQSIIKPEDLDPIAAI